MERVTREGLAEKFALQLYAEEAERWRNKVSVCQGEMYPTPAEISRLAVERADALREALGVGVSGRRKTVSKVPCAVKRSRAVNGSKGKPKNIDPSGKVWRASVWLEENHAKGATAEEAAKLFGVKAGTLKTYRMRWIDEGRAKPLPGGPRPDAAVIEANRFYEAGNCTIAEAEAKHGLKPGKLARFRIAQLEKVKGGAE